MFGLNKNYEYMCILTKYLCLVYLNNSILKYNESLVIRVLYISIIIM